MPKHARPSSLRDDIDFNDRISIDGLVWTNIHGKTFHMYHVLDWGTNFHMATIAPSKSTEDVIQAMLTMWLSWAGIPGELLVDAASELNSEGFMHFLQSHNIRATTISPEAHFQNGRSERHGAILQHMLTKFNAEHNIDSYADLQNPNILARLIYSASITISNGTFWGGYCSLHFQTRSKTIASW